MRLIDADKLEPSELYMDGFTRIVYMDDIDEMPIVDAEPVKHGHWIPIWKDYSGRKMRCSECGVDFYVTTGKHANYCYNCGARMDEERR